MQSISLATQPTPPNPPTPTCREKESVLKGCCYNAAVSTADNCALLAAGSDRKIKELEDAAVGRRGGMRI